MNNLAEMKRKPRVAAWWIMLAALLMGACTMKPAQLNIEGLEQPLALESILDSASGRTVTFDQLLDRLEQAKVVYVGERHNSPRHHQLQLQVIRALVERGHRVSVGMEMFDHTYQERLDRWSAGQMTWEEFLRQTHWYANWRFDDNLYKDILLYVHEQNLALVGLNVPFHLPRKISIGGLDSLLESERALLPGDIDTTHPEHRAYVEKIYKMHKMRGRDNFEYFYEAQCTWEDGMALNVSEHLGDGIMVVLAGNGHIMKKFGIPQRAHKRSGAPYLTVYLATPSTDVERDDGDFIWLTTHALPETAKKK